MKYEQRKEEQSEIQKVTIWRMLVAMNQQKVMDISTLTYKILIYTDYNIDMIIMVERINQVLAKNLRNNYL